MGKTIYNGGKDSLSNAILTGTLTANSSFGTSGQALKSTGTGVEWGTVATGGMTVIASGSFSGGSLTISSIPQTYRSLRLVMQPSVAANANLLISLNTAGSYGHYDGGYFSAGPGVNTGSATGTNGFNIILGQVIAGSATLCIVDIPEYTLTNACKSFVSTFAIPYQISRFTYAKANEITGPVTALILSNQYLETTTGTYTLYGVK